MENKEIRISVVMATYQGEKYIKQQIDSILKNLDKQDELIISDDGSKDKTKDIVQEYMKADTRIRLLDGPKLGVKQNFANGIQQAKGKYIFLSDQDDIWMENKVEEVLPIFEDDTITLVIHDAKVIDENEKVILPSFFEYRKSGKGIIKNIWKNTYIGCCMAFRAQIKEEILPIPNTIEMHDQWIGIINDKIGKSYFLNKTLISYRRHSNNVSQMQHYGFRKMLQNRKNILSSFIKYCFSGKE